MNIELGKRIFFECYGNSFTICREYGKEYKKCKIPQEYEIKWCEEIRKQLYKSIRKTNGDTRFSLFLRLCDIVSWEESIKLTCELLNSHLDCFERLLYTEHLKQLNIKEDKYELKEIITKNKTILNDNICLVKEDSKGYCVLTEDSIKERINKL